MFHPYDVYNYAMRDFLRSPKNYVIAAMVAVMSFVLLIYAPSIAFVVKFASNGQPASEVVRALWIVFTTPPLEVLAWDLYFMIIVSLLIGVNVSLLIAYSKLQIRRRGLRIAGFLSIFVSLLGAGCAACGVTILASISYALGGVGLLTFFADQSTLIGYLGIVMLLLSCYTLARGLNAPLVC